ncbi:MAG: hypothetical protein N3D76_05850 [Geminocystis sp.]|nr:hypothetical protein [Geminocystis sp.]HIK38750.1 hypothetical protein [Geminocystis sp. M7585_C2015_104]
MSRKRVKSGSGFAVAKSVTKSRVSVSVSQETKKILEKLTKETQETESALLDKIFQGDIAISGNNPDRVITIKSREDGELYGEVSPRSFTESEYLQERLEYSEKRQKELEEKIQQLESLLTEKNKENEQIAEKLERLVAEDLEKLENSESKRRELEEKIQQLEGLLAEKARENQLIAEKLNKLAASDSKRAEIEKKVKQMEKLLAEKNEENQRLLDNLANKIAAVSRLEKQLANQKEETETLKNTWEKRQLELSEKIASIQKDNENLIKELARIKNLEEVATEKTKEVSKLQLKIADLESRNRQKEEEQKGLINMINNLERQKESLERKIVKDSYLLAEKEAYISQQKNIIEGLQKRIAELESVTAIADYTLNKWRTRFYI